MSVGRVDTIALDQNLASAEREKRRGMGCGGSFGEGDAVGGAIELVLKLELVGTSVNEQTLIGVHSTKLEFRAGRITHEGGHLILVLAEEDAIVALAHSLQNRVVHRSQLIGGRSYGWHRRSRYM